MLRENYRQIFLADSRQHKRASDCSCKFEIYSWQKEGNAGEFVSNFLEKKQNKNGTSALITFK